MKTPPSPKGSGRGVRNRDKLRAWLAEWRADQLLGEHEAAGAGVVLGLRSRPKTAKGLKEGAIVLLQPACPVAAARPRYLAVLNVDAEADEMLVAPFSRFGCPAVRGELLMRADSLPVRVLCLWNARRVCASGLPPFWKTGRLTAKEVADAIVIRNGMASGAAVPKQLEHRVGPPLQHPLDPRHDYIADERHWLNACLPQADAMQLKRDDEPSSYLLAAEGKAQYRADRKPRRGRTR